MIHRKQLNGKVTECFGRSNNNISLSSSYNKILLITVKQSKRLAVFLYPKGGLIKLKTYIYPENLRSNIKLCFWSVRDFIIICGGIVLSVIVLVNLWNFLPIAATACFSFLSLRVDETATLFPTAVGQAGVSMMALIIRRRCRTKLMKWRSLHMISAKKPVRKQKIFTPNESEKQSEQ